MAGSAETKLTATTAEAIPVVINSHNSPTLNRKIQGHR
jgi:hypothetical protein